MEQIFLIYCPPKETYFCNNALQKHENTKAMVQLLDRDIDFFDIVAGIFQEDTLALYLFIIYLDYVLQLTIYLRKENCLRLKS